MEIINELKTNGFVITRVIGNSMKPFLLDNESVIIETVNKDIKRLDVVLYIQNNKCILHRVIKIDNDTLYVRGDNNLAIETISIKEVYGILKSYCYRDKYIDITSSINLRYYYRSLLTYPLRLIKGKYENK